MKLSDFFGLNICAIVAGAAGSGDSPINRLPEFLASNKQSDEMRGVEWSKNELFADIELARDIFWGNNLDMSWLAVSGIRDLNPTCTQANRKLSSAYGGTARMGFEPRSCPLEDRRRYLLGYQAGPKTRENMSKVDRRHMVNLGMHKHHPLHIETYDHKPKLQHLVFLKEELRVVADVQVALQQQAAAYRLVLTWMFPALVVNPGQ
uniref:Uncharacterized protein n=1 Tax=Anopheles culicifacies TaxID=139723 RepID=A0A182MUK2_9DIPT